jgi:hypothetical protein
MPKVDKIVGPDGTEYRWFECPGCKWGHNLPITGPRAWGYNGNDDQPTFTPSILARTDFNNGKPSAICHSYVRDGKIEFLSDCTHALAGKTVDLDERKA